MVIIYQMLKIESFNHSFTSINSERFSNYHPQIRQTISSHISIVVGLIVVPATVSSHGQSSQNCSVRSWSLAVHFQLDVWSIITHAHYGCAVNPARSWPVQSLPPKRPRDMVASGAAASLELCWPRHARPGRRTYTKPIIILYSSQVALELMDI